MEQMNLRNYAYIGDAVWELFVREKNVFMTNNSEKLHKITTEKVKASYQSELLYNIEENLTEEEKELARRARNLPIPVARRTNQTEYRQATAFEALIGFWYLENRKRLNEILEKIRIAFDNQL